MKRIILSLALLSPACDDAETSSGSSGSSDCNLSDGSTGSTTEGLSGCTLLDDLSCVCDGDIVAGPESCGCGLEEDGSCYCGNALVPIEVCVPAEPLLPGSIIIATAYQPGAFFTVQNDRLGGSDTVNAVGVELLAGEATLIATMLDAVQITGGPMSVAPVGGRVTARFEGASSRFRVQLKEDAVVATLFPTIAEKTELNSALLASEP